MLDGSEIYDQSKDPVFVQVNEDKDDKDDSDKGN